MLEYCEPDRTNSRDDSKMDCRNAERLDLCRLSRHGCDQEVAADGERNLSAISASTRTHASCTLGRGSTRENPAIRRWPRRSTPPYSIVAHVLAAQARCWAKVIFRIMLPDYPPLNDAHVLLYDRSTESLPTATVPLRRYGEGTPERSERGDAQWRRGPDTHATGT